MNEVILFQRYALHFWAEREFAILKELTETSIEQQDALIPDADKALLEHIKKVHSTLPACKKNTKPKSKKLCQTFTNEETNNKSD